MMSQCAVHMFDQGQIKVKVIIHGFTLYDFFMFPLYNSWRVGDILKLLGKNVQYRATMCRAHA